MARRWFASLLLSAISLTASAADEPKPKARPTAEVLRAWGGAQEQLARQYRECQNRMFLLAQRLEKGGDAERRAAIAFRKALEVAEREGVSNRFARLVHFAGREARLRDLVRAVEDSQTQIKVLGGMLDVLVSEDRVPELRKELEGCLSRIREVAAGQARLVGRIKEGGDLERLAGELRKLTDALRAALGKADAADSPGAARLREALRQHALVNACLEAARRDQAATALGRAAAELKAAVGQMELVVRQLREEEAEGLKRDLAGRFQHLLALQVKVRAEAKELARQIGNGRPTIAQIQRSQVLADLQRDVLGEADKVILLLEAAEKPPVPAGRLRRLRDMMAESREHLNRADVGKTLLTAQQDLVDELLKVSAAVSPRAEADPQVLGGFEEAVARLTAETEEVASALDSSRSRFRAAGEALQAAERPDDLAVVAVRVEYMALLAGKVARRHRDALGACRTRLKELKEQSADSPALARREQELKPLLDTAAGDALEAYQAALRKLRDAVDAKDVRAARAAGAEVDKRLTAACDRFREATVSGYRLADRAAPARQLRAIQQAQAEQSAALKRIIKDLEAEILKDLFDDPKQP